MYKSSRSLPHENSSPMTPRCCRHLHLLTDALTLHAHMLQPLPARHISVLAMARHNRNRMHPTCLGIANDLQNGLVSARPSF